VAAWALRAAAPAAVREDLAVVRAALLRSVAEAEAAVPRQTPSEEAAEVPCPELVAVRQALVVHPDLVVLGAVV
jgi:hypothetical protein